MGLVFYLNKNHSIASGFCYERNFFFFASSIAFFTASRFFVFLEREVLFFVFTAILFAIDLTIYYLLKKKNLHIAKM